MAASITGVTELAKAMREIPDELKQKVGKRMVASGAGIVRKRVKTIIRAKGLVKSGALVNNIVVKQDKQAPEFTIQYNVGVRHGRHLTRKQRQNIVLSKRRGRISKRYQNDPFYWRFLNFKTIKRAATPFVEPGLEQSTGEVISQMTKVAEKELLKARV